MTHDKPKVTIDLAEYNELLNFRDNEYKLFYSALYTMGKFISDKYPETSMNDIDNYLRDNAKIKLVMEKGTIKLSKIL